MDEITFHYPPDLLKLLTDVIPLLCKSKKDVLLFFQGAGVPQTMTADLARRVATDRENIHKFEIASTVLTRLNERGEPALRERREVVKRVVEFEDLSACWESDRLKAQGLISAIRGIVNVRDSFTRMRQEQERERHGRQAEAEKKATAEREKRAAREAIRSDLNRLFSETDPWKRGKQLEVVLNQLFGHFGIAVRESFTLRGDASAHIVEQIDGVIELVGHIYLVEIKWTAERLGPGEVSQHMVRVFGRNGSRGIFVSQAGYTDAAIKQCTDCLGQGVLILCELAEIVLVLEQGRDLLEFLKDKVRGTIVEKQSFFRVPA